MMKKFFSLNFYLDSLNRIKVSAIVFFVFTVMGAVGSALPHLMSYLSSDFDPSVKITKQILTLLDVSTSAGSFVLVFVPIMTLLVFSYLYRRCESDFYQALPYSRRAVLISSALAVFTVAALTLILSSLLGLVFILPCLGKTVEYRFFVGLLEFFGLLLSSAVAICITALAVSVTGTVVNGAFVAFTLMLAPRAILSLVNASVEALCPTLIPGHAIPLFDNNYNMLASLLFGSQKVLSAPFAFVYTFVLGVLYAALAYIFFLKRKSEYATHSFANKLFRHLTSILLSLLIVTFGIYLVSIDEMLSFFAVFVFAAAVGIYFAYSLVTGRKQRGVLSTLKVLPILIGASGIIAVTVIVSSHLFNSYSPDSEDIKSVSVLAREADDWYNYYEYSEYVAKRAEKITLSDTESKQIIATAVKRGNKMDKNQSYVAVNMKIKTAYNSYRTLSLTDEEYKKIVTKLAENKEYEAIWLNVAEGASSVSVSNYTNIVGDDAEAILAALAAEVRECGFEKWFSAYRDTDDAARLQYYTEIDGQTIIVSLPITEQMPKTYAIYLEKERIATEKLMSKMKSAIESCVSGKGDELFVSFNFTQDDKSTYWLEDELTEGDNEQKDLFLEIFGLLSTDHVSYEDNVVYVNIHVESSFYEYYSCSFKVSFENLDRLTEIFEEYGETYRFE